MPPQHHPQYASAPGGGYHNDQGYLHDSYDGLDYDGPAPPYEHAVGDRQGYYGGGVVGSVARYDGKTLL